MMKIILSLLFSNIKMSLNSRAKYSNTKVFASWHHYYIIGMHNNVFFYMIRYRVAA